MDNTKLAIFMLVFSVTFQFFGYALTSFTYPIGEGLISIQTEDLFEIGIFLGVNDEENISYGGGWVSFNLNTSTFRVRWDRTFGQDVLWYNVRGNFFGFEYWSVKDFVNEGNYLDNATIVNNWNNNYNFSRFKMESGHEFFITDPSGEANITKAVYDTGTIRVTIAENLNIQEQPNLRSFINWYSGLISGQNTFGLPDSFILILQLITIIGVFSVVVLVKEIFTL